MDSNRGRRVVADAGGLIGFLHAVAVVAGAFDRAGAVAFAARRDEQVRDVAQVLGELVSPLLRGECPLFRWRCGGSGVGPW